MEKKPAPITITLEMGITVTSLPGDLVDVEIVGDMKFIIDNVVLPFYALHGIADAAKIEFGKLVDIHINQAKAKAKSDAN